MSNEILEPTVTEISSRLLWISLPFRPFLEWDVPALVERLEFSLADIRVLLAKLKMYEDFDIKGEDGFFEPPHPIFLLAEERDAFMKLANEAKAQLEAIDKILAGAHKRPRWGTIDRIKAVRKGKRIYRMPRCIKSILK